jgi:hypothetical protein
MADKKYVNLKQSVYLLAVGDIREGKPASADVFDLT